MASRLVQPYRRGARNPGPALSAMTRGRSFGGGNPKDLERSVQRLISAGQGKQGARPQRPKRPPRPVRPPRP